jgi:putative acetyltransferase
MESIRFTVLHEAPEQTGYLSGLLSEYGTYMFELLNLAAGKEQFFQELALLPMPDFCPPNGAYLLVLVNEIAVGCAAIKRWDAVSCELKRMYLRPLFRGRGMGEALCRFALEHCRKMGYQRVLLDTNEEMAAAVQLYQKCGFFPIPPYCDNENEHALYMAYLF